jgi:hypothetical protein
VKSGVSLFRCLACMSVSMVALLWAYKFGRHPRRTDASCPSSVSPPLIALAEGQTVLAVVDRQKSMHFYVGNDGEDRAYYA